MRSRCNHDAVTLTHATIRGLTFEHAKPGAPGVASKPWRISKRAPPPMGTPHLSPVQSEVDPLLNDLII